MKHKNIIQRMAMPLPELENYYRERRKNRYEQGIPLRHIRFRKIFYPVFAKFLTLDRILRKQTITVIGNHRKYKERTIFACTHIGENDVENIYEILHQNCWWFIGDPCILYKDISGLLVYLNGCIMLETDDKEDRHIAYLRSLELLKGGGSLLIFPEGARNGSENLPVMPLFAGTSKMAMVTHTKIVPIAIEQFDKRFVVNMGTELLPEDYHHVDELTKALRDTLATLKWEIWEREGQFARADLSEDYGKQFAEIFEQRIQPWDTLESVERSRFHTKDELEQREFLIHLDILTLSKENAFLFRKY